MLIDRYGRSHTTNSPEAIAAVEDATFALAAHRPLAASLARAQAAEPDLVAIPALKSLGGAMLGRTETMVVAKREALAAKAALARNGGGTRGEIVLVAAADDAAQGRLSAAAQKLEDHLVDEPRDFLAAKLSHSMRFMAGAQEQMLATTTRVLKHWTDADAGYGFLLGCHAFGLEEVGRYGEAETVGRRAVRLEPSDAWGLHAVSHVMEMSGRVEEGIEWLEASRPLWPDCNNFKFHLAWHIGLLRLEQGDDQGVLELYDRDVMPTASDDFRDMANAVSLLWRLQQSGVDVGARWEQLRAVALKRQADVTYVFASLHYLLALIANHEYAAAAKLMSELVLVAQDDCGDQAGVAREVGAGLAEIIQAYSDIAPGRTPDMPVIASRLTQLGGSNAQRDLFMRILLVAASEGHDRGPALAIARLRSQLRWQDRFARRLSSSRSVRAFGEQLAQVRGLS